MARKTSPEPVSGDARPFIPAIMGWGGPAMLVAGLVLMQRANVSMGRSMDGAWYAGLGLCVAGVFFWLTAGMTREQVWEWLKGAGLALACALIIRWAIAEPYRIPSSSMETTLHGDPRFGRGDRVFVNKWIYGIRAPFMNKRLFYGKAPQRWDIVVFKSVEPDAIHKTLVKRIVGLPGERIHIRQGKVYVNGEPLSIPDFMPPGMYYTSPPDARYGILADDQYSLVPPGHYLVLGDNSAQSRDGRYFGWVPNEHIVGRVACIWWPPSRWRDFTGFSRTLWWRGSVIALLALVFTRAFVGRLWTVRAGERRTRHAVFFPSYGLRIPMTRKWLIRWRVPARGDRVLCLLTEKESGNEAYLLGTVIGAPGDRLSRENGEPRLNGKTLAEWGVTARSIPEIVWDEETESGGKRGGREIVLNGSCAILSEEIGMGPDERRPRIHVVPLQSVLGRCYPIHGVASSVMPISPST
ncbi:MAG TPA: signal peptidase I [Candidatus Hydrogenedentes bacterium]|nr:signal peptidase I [Candidatus Hydrogenedentota bacterium]